MRILLSGALFGISFGFFLVKVVSISLENLTWNPGWVGALSVLALLPMALAIWLRRCANKVEQARALSALKAQIMNAQALNAEVSEGRHEAPLIVAWIGIVLTILGCIGCVSAYLQHIAVDAFNTLKWESDVSPIDRWDVPSVAVFYGANDAAYANFSATIKQRCFYPVYGSHNCADVFTFVPKFHSEIYGDLTGYFFDGSGIVLANQSSNVLLQTFVNYNSQHVSSTYDTPAPQNPYLYYAIFDSALNFTGFTNALECGAVALSEMPALGSTTFSITPYAVNDTLNALKLTNEACKDIYDNGKSHRFYTSQIASTGISNSDSCDTSSKSYNSGNACISQVIVHYGSTYLTTYWSKREKENTEILIDIGGIVGGVCFVFWFLGIFAVR